jgi:23S rRNA (pseudouridine1915-N3)-methyltransferase
MKYIISFIGKSKTTDEDIIAKKYLKRLNNVVIKQHEVKTNNIKLKMMEEGSKLIKATPLNGKLILLDEQGENLSSNDLAKLILEWEENNVSIVNFAIGGAYGNGEEIKKKADKIIAFGRQTWPHQMVKMMVAEQVYRIDTLLKGHPYHK